ncbi:MAG: hypothetical protein ACE5HI_16630 [bacterium]
MRRLIGTLLAVTFVVTLFIAFSSQEASASGSNIYLLERCITRVFQGGPTAMGWQCIRSGGSWWFAWCELPGGGGGGNGDGDPEP